MSSSEQYCDDVTGTSQPPDEITIHVHPTTGGQFSINISSHETAEELRRRISRRLQTPKERLKVLFKEQVLETKPLKDYMICNGSKVTLLPSVESGFSSTVQGTQQSIIQAIESLSDPQIDDFLSGRLPLTLALRVGDHMMFVQLQLEQSQANAQNGDSRSSRSHQSAGSSNLRRHPAYQRAISQRLFSDMSSASTIPSVSNLPNDFQGTKTTVTRSQAVPLMAESVIAGPASKVPKLTAKSESVETDKNFTNSEHSLSGVLHKSHAFQHHSAPSSPEELPYSFLDPRLDALQHPYNRLAHINHYSHPQAGTNHLHRLVTACSSLEQVVAIPPSASAERLQVPRTLHETHAPRRSPRKRPSTLLATPTGATNAPPQLSPQSTYPDAVSNHDVPNTAALIHNALLHHPLGFPPLSVISSAYAKYQASRSDSNEASTPPSSSSSSNSEAKLKHPITSDMLRNQPHTSASSMMQAISKHHNSRSERHHHHRRSVTSARLTSGTLSHHASSLSGNRVARQMQRLRRLCGSHQQCVAYSSRELASEISSIVHMAKHHSRSDSSHRKTHKACKECHGRSRASTSGTSSSLCSQQRSHGSQAAGASIDSFTTHGPGIFSGTFSGSLHPSIQDPDGKPKRDPKTILQILTDLLTATQQYQGQLGGVGLLPQIFKDHFKNEQGGIKPRETLTRNTMEIGNETKASQRPYREDSKPTVPVQQHRVDYRHATVARNNNTSSPKSDNKQRKLPPPAQYLSSVSTIPIGNLPMAYASKHGSSRSARKTSSSHDGSKQHRHRHSQSARMERCCSSHHCKRMKLQASANASNNKRENENTNTKNKMKELLKKMEQQRRRRQNRRASNKASGKQTPDDVTEKTKDTVKTRGSAFPLRTGSQIIDTPTSNGVENGKIEVPFDDIKDYEIKEVSHESPETVTV